MKRLEMTKTNVIDRIIIAMAPLLTGMITIAILIYVTQKNSIVIDSEAGIELIKSIIDIWGVLLGFIITAVSILLTLGENSFINTLIETNHMQSIIFSYVMASIYLFLSLVVAIIVLFVNLWNKTVMIAFISMNVVIAFSMALCIYFLFAVVMKMQQ